MTTQDTADYQAAQHDPEALAALHARWDSEDAERHARLARPEALAEAATWYCQAGIPVFPLIPRQKRPLTTNGFKDASTDPEQVAAWWRTNPQANIGMPTGTIADVIDIDGPAGVLSIAGNTHQPDYITALRQRATGIVSTPRPGGLHYWVPPGQFTNSASKLLPGVDTRGLGGYVVLPPSITDDHGSGRRYTWIKPLAMP